MKDCIHNIVTEAEETSGATIQVERKYHLPSVYNDPELYDE